ncbi:hypothetical protein FHR90_001666 [Endobacter medicaginis]|jgi:hypothetical protein|uniref:Uncharacterized protein n=1 Tax=Endobacter medicaginis TaxID=1181271 RepID=A0A839UZT4_9PROT|nr:hypothetical protein [Endobacter medicaginis]MBB3173834.1 hypothetical protein [Endobacter medicaginis]MCX5477052.1 hypothetical protein [Endobacter medicaginis]NVN31316.1 hypothetical protein [Endobacter medicaginis]
MTTLATHGAATLPGFDLNPRDVLAAIRRRMPTPLVAPQLISASLHVATFAVSLLPSAAIAGMFILR